MLSVNQGQFACVHKTIESLKSEFRAIFIIMGDDAKKKAVNIERDSSK